MEKETIEEAVGFIEAAVGNIRRAIETEPGREKPRDGITLGEFIQLLGDGVSLTVDRPMMGRLWSTKIVVTSKKIDGVEIRTTRSLNDFSILKSKVERVFTENSGALAVRIAQEDK